MNGRSHPPALLRRTERTLREETPLGHGDRILVAVSGGGDSMALLHVLARLAPRFGIELHAHGVNHGLRAAASQELDLAQALALRLGIPFSCSLLALEEGGNLQARARQARYTALDSVAETIGARWVATAHHANDRAETVLMRILRGTSRRGEALLPAASERRLRPFIRSSSSAIALHLGRHGLVHASDPSNRDPRFLRTRIRHELIPLLEELTPGATDHLNLLADEWSEPDAVVLTDEQGRPLTLRTSQAAQIRRARNLGQTDARVWLAGGRDIRVQHALGKARPEAGGNPGPARKKPRPAQQKQGERGAKPTKSD